MGINRLNLGLAKGRIGSFSFSFSWASVLTLATFWSYGYMAAVFTSSPVAKIVLTVGLLGILVFFYTARDRFIFQDTFTFSSWNVLCFFSYGLGLFFLSPRELFYDLQGDQLFHAQYAHVHAVKSLRLLAPRMASLSELKASFLISVFNWGILLGSVFFIWIMKRLSRSTQVLLLSVAFLTWRLGLLSFGGNIDVHPVFRLFPLWLSSTVFSISNFGFRLPQFLALIGVMTFVAEQAKRFVSPKVAWLLGAALGTVPVLWHVGTLVEPSIWSAVGLTLLFVSVYKSRSEMESLNIVRFASILAVFTLMRQPTLAGYIPLGLITLYLFARSDKKRRIDLLWSLTPVLAMLPSLLNALVHGTPATQGTGYEELAGLNKLWFAIQSGMAFKAVLNSVMWPPLVFFALAFIPWGKKDISAPVNALGFFVLFFLFYSIEMGLWGMGRYQAEYILPFVAVGLLKFAEVFRAKPGVSYAVLTAFLVWNVSTFYRLSKINPPVDVRKASKPIDTRVLSQLVYPYGEAMKEAKKAGFAGQLHVAGFIYGGFSEILNGYSLKEYLSDFNIMNSIPGGSRANAMALDQFDRVKLILVSDLNDPGFELMTGLNERGWQPWKKFVDSDHGSTIATYIRRSEP